MSKVPVPYRSRLAGLALSQFLAIAFMAVCLGWVLRELALILPNDRIVAALSVEQAVGSVLAWQLAAFAGVLLLCHLLLGLAAFGLARLTEIAFADDRLPRRGLLIGGWFALLAGLVMAANSTWHPGSLFSGEESWLRSRPFFGVQTGEALLLTFIALVLLLMLRALQRFRPVKRGIALGFAGASAFVGLAVLLSPFVTSRSTAATVAGAAPHIVIIGVDSLRDDLAASSSGPPLTPEIDRFLAGAYRFTDAVSPMARTYPAWVSILTGRHPVTTGARFNLMPRELVHEGTTLGDALQAHGYHAVYATDEVRFANFDKSFGFDQMITPPIGAIDFLLGYSGDIPLVNLVASTAIGGLLFPSLHANRAAHLTYQSEQFVDRLDDEIVVEGPSLLAIHLTLGHWPYIWGGAPAPTTPQGYRPAYRNAIKAVDRQFDEVMRMLEHKGVLDNAVVVVLSDHGEALGGKTDSMLRETGTSHEIWRSLWGHGNSVMSPHQFGVILAMRAYGRARLPGAPGTFDWPVTLEDVRPTLEELVTGAAPAGVDGMSLVPLLATRGNSARITSRIRFTETGFNTESTLAGRYEASGVIDEAAVFYELNPATGWVQFRQDRLPGLLARKQRAALSSHSLLAAIPDHKGGNPRYLYTDRHNPLPRVLTGRPDAEEDPEAARLWDALQERFPGELSAAADLP